jgi:hypothetical protein
LANVQLRNAAHRGVTGPPLWWSRSSHQAERLLGDSSLVLVPSTDVPDCEAFAWPSGFPHLAFLVRHLLIAHSDSWPVTGLRR